MTEDPADDVPAAQPRKTATTFAPGAEDARLDLRRVANVLQRDADSADVIDQAIVVPTSDDDCGVAGQSRDCEEISTSRHKLSAVKME
jgi:hypothetical protein